MADVPPSSEPHRTRCPYCGDYVTTDLFVRAITASPLLPEPTRSATAMKRDTTQSCKEGIFSLRFSAATGT